MRSVYCYESDVDYIEKLCDVLDISTAEVIENALLSYSNELIEDARWYKISGINPPFNPLEVKEVVSTYVGPDAEETRI